MGKTGILNKLLRISGLLPDKLVDRSDEQRVRLSALQEPEQSSFCFSRSRRESVDNQVVLRQRLNRTKLMLKRLGNDLTDCLGDKLRVG